MDNRKIYPKLPDLPGVDERALDSFDEYITGVIAQARAAVGSSRSKLGDDKHGWLAAQRLYWQHGASILTWLRGQMRRMRTIRDQRRRKDNGDRPRADGPGL
jgi:hypothetical protein